MAAGVASFGQGTGPIWIDDLTCSGTESNIAFCRHSNFGVHNCDHSEDAGVYCPSQLTTIILLLLLLLFLLLLMLVLVVVLMLLSLLFLLQLLLKMLLLLLMLMVVL